MLSSKKITLLDPMSWDDKNDAYFMAQYKERKELKSLLALCFSQVPETYHHWHVFAKGPAGVCIEFDRKALLEAFKKRKGISSESIQYLTLNEAKEFEFDVQRLPFVKRYGYKPEGEFRVIYESKSNQFSSLGVSITPECIRKIVLSPWLHKALSTSAIQAIQGIEGFDEVTISRSTLISNDVWKSYSLDL